MKCQGFKPYLGNPAVRHYRGGLRKRGVGEIVNPSRNRKGETGNPSPSHRRARVLSQPRVLTAYAGYSWVLTPHGVEACSQPPKFYLSSGLNSGVMLAAYVLDLPNGGFQKGFPRGLPEADSGPISVDLPAGVEITANYQAGFDATRVCSTATNLNIISSQNMVPNNFTVVYWTREKNKRR